MPPTWVPGGHRGHHSSQVMPDLLVKWEKRELGQCRVRNTCVCFHPLQPKIVCVNDTPENWIRAVEGMSDSDEQPLKKRLLFVHVDTAVLAEEAVAAHERGLDALVEEGKRRRLERVRTLCGTVAEAETATGPGDASPRGQHHDGRQQQSDA